MQYLKRKVCRILRISGRCYCTKNSVRVRFAPSPTGNLHLGGLRTALYNYLFSRVQNGKFILRIEDTDRKRTIPGSCEKIISDLTWCGIIPDEGPTFGGDFGPYIQSCRQDLYQEFAKKLVQNGAAYYCFCTEKRLELLREDALKKNMVPKYDNKCKNLTPKEVMLKLSSDTDKCVRFKLTDSKPFNDIVYGTVLHEVEDIEGDPVILKKDGWPTYHLANVVDDYTMNISHVIRGVEWLQSTNKHIMIYNALGCKPPQFAHMPLLLNADGSKFSKRQKSLSLESLKEKGILPNAIINFISYTSTGFNLKDEPFKIWSVNELAKRFNLSELGTASSRLPLDRLEEYNSLEIWRQISNPEEIDLLINDVIHLVKKTFLESAYELDLEYEHVKKILIWSTPRLSYLKDLVKKDFQFLWIKPGKLDLNLNDQAILNELKQELSKQNFEEKNNLNIYLKNFSKSRNIPFKNLMLLLRNVISGLQNGPGVAEMLNLLGKEKCITRIENALNEVPYSKENVKQSYCQNQKVK